MPLLLPFTAKAKRSSASRRARSATFCNVMSRAIA